MRANGVALVTLTAAAAGICVTLSGCGSGARAPAGSTLAATRQAEIRPQGRVPRSPPATATAAAGPAASAAPAGHAPASGRSVSAMLASGLYIDGPDGTPHYVLSFTSGAGRDIKGSASYLYQDGRIVTAGSYAGTLSGGGKITLTLGDGKILSGRYTGGRLNLAGCAAALPLATAAGCTFTYNGHVP